MMENDKLSDAYIRLSADRQVQFAFCPKCHEHWIDDQGLIQGAILCPNDCGYSLVRGLDYPGAAY